MIINYQNMTDYGYKNLTKVQPIFVCGEECSVRYQFIDCVCSILKSDSKFLALNVYKYE